MSPAAKTIYKSALKLNQEERNDLARALAISCRVMPAAVKLKNGAELVAYLQAEGLIGYRKDIKDSQAHARMLREKGQRRRRKPEKS